jgi:hypothetical protein
MVTRTEFENHMVSVFKEEGGYVTVETSKEDTELMEGLLGMSPGMVSNSQVKFMKGSESCRDCGHHYGPGIIVVGI